MLKHVKPDITYKEQCLEYIKEHEEYNSDMNGSSRLKNYKDNYEEWLLYLKENESNKLKDGKVPSETYLLIDDETNKLIGMINICKHLNEQLKEHGGHIGYGIRPTERRKGYNKINLYLGLKRCLELGLDEVYLHCIEDNQASYKTMEALGGILISKYYNEQRGNCRKYKINVKESIIDYQDLYEQ